jgi:mono/diheme cytochrome c family protein
MEAILDLRKSVVDSQGALMNSVIHHLTTVLALVAIQSQLIANIEETNMGTEQGKNRTNANQTPQNQKLGGQAVRQTYLTYCSHCHGRDGRATTLVERVMPEMPDFSRFDWSDYKQSEIVASIADGTGQMPGFIKILTKQEMELLASMVTNFPSGTPSSLIQKRARFLEADLRLLQKSATLGEELRSHREKSSEEK